MVRDSLSGKILLYVTSSEDSIVAAQYAIWLAKTTHQELIAMYVVDIKTLNELLKARIFVKMEELDYERDLEDDGKRYLDHVKELAEAKGVRVETILLKGEVHKEVVSKLKELNCDLLVMGELEAQPSRRDFYYSEEERIFREAGCSVLVVKGEEKTAELYENLP